MCTHYRASCGTHSCRSAWSSLGMRQLKVRVDRPPSIAHTLATLPLTTVAVGADMAGDLVLVDASTKDVDMAGDEGEAEGEEETEMADGEEAEEATASGRARTLVSMPPLSAALPQTTGCQPLPRPPFHSPRFAM